MLFSILKKLFVFLPIIIVGLSCSKTEKIASEVVVTALKCEYAINPLGIDKLKPRLSWELRSSQRGEKQTAYQILVASTPENLRKNRGDVWDTGKVKSSQSIQVPYRGKALKSRKRYYWKVRIWDKDGQMSAYSEPAWWEMGLLEKKDWKAKWISAPRVFDWNKRAGARQSLRKDAPPVHDDPSPIFRKEFKVQKKIKSARIYISGLGYYELYLNGEKVGDHILDPAFTNYSKRILYGTYDVTDMVEHGGNAIGVMLGNGWYNMFTRAVWSFDRAPWRNDPTFLCQLELTYADGTKQTIVSDGTWKCAPGPVIFNSIRQGETYDANLEQNGWNKSGFNAEKWYNVRVVQGPDGKLFAQMMPSIKILQETKPQNVTKIRNKTYVVDFGQNIAGFIKLKVKGKKGQKIIIKYGERLNNKGLVDQKEISEYVREKRFQTDIYVMKGSRVEIWHPRFTYHGFRYVEVKGFPEVPNGENLRACVVHTAFDTAGYFQCSNKLLNRIQQNTLWSYVNNFHGYPTDCPQREKNGWLNDAQLASETGLFNFQSQSAYIKWIYDMLDSQMLTGAIPPIVPTSGWGYQWNIGPAYDNAMIILPWNLYLYSGDIDILEHVYRGMKKYFENYRNQAKGYLIDLGLGDWCTAKTQTPKIITATAYYYLEARLLSRIAQLLGKKHDAQEYSHLASNIKNAFQKNFLDMESNTPPTQTTLGCALYMGLVDSSNTDKILDRLTFQLSSGKMILDFGVIGAKTVLNGLTLFGRPGIAYQIVDNTRYPGWGYWVKQGATTLWETWDGKKLSLDHIMFGDVSAWFYKTLAGIRPDSKQPGFKHFYVIPFIPDDLDWVDAEYKTLYGKIKVKWEKIDRKLEFLLNVPVNTTATVELPAKKIQQVKESGKPISESEVESVTKNKVVINVESGYYHFEVNLP